MRGTGELERECETWKRGRQKVDGFVCAISALLPQCPNAPPISIPAPSQRGHSQLHITNSVTCSFPCVEYMRDSVLLQCTAEDEDTLLSALGKEREAGVGMKLRRRP